MSHHPIHFLQLMGLPGSGKTSYANTLNGYTIVSADAIGRKQGISPVDDPNAQNIEEVCQQAYESILRGAYTVLDGPSPTAQRRAMLGLIDMAEENLGKPVYRELLVFRIPTKLAVERNLNRENPVSDEAFTRHYVHFEKGLTEIGTEGWDNIQFVYE